MVFHRRPLACWKEYDQTKKLFKEILLRKINEVTRENCSVDAVKTGPRGITSTQETKEQYCCF